MVGDTGIEPVTPSMSTKCSTAELITHFATPNLRPKQKWGAGSPRRWGAIKGVEAGIKGFWLCYEVRYVFYDERIANDCCRL